MAKDLQNKKRKASGSEVGAEKVKKVKDVTSKISEAPLKKRKATEDVAPVKSKKSKSPLEEQESKRSKPTKKDDGDAIAPVVSKKVPASSKKTNGAEKSKIAKTEVSAPGISKDKKTVKSAASKTAKRAVTEAIDPEDEETDDIEVDDQVDDEESEEDDQTLALIKGFESDQEEEATASGEGYNEGGPIPKLPADALAMSKKQQKKLKKLDASSVAEEPGVVYIGRIPHGFFENEMKAYFTQFGKILRLRLSRNKRTGASKHFAFIEFESATVAEIVAKTMDSYLLFNHILKVKLVPAEQVHGDLFKGANKRFKKVPWNKLEGRRLGQAVSEEKWDQRVEREEQRRKERADKMKAIGYEFDAPKVKTTKQITRQEKSSLVLADEKDAEKPVAIEPAPAVETSSIPAKKGRKAKAVAKEVKALGSSEPAKPVESEAQEDVESTPAAPPASKGEKGKKSKASKTAADGVESETADALAKPQDKNKKVVEAVEAPAAEVVIDVPEKKVRKKKSKATLTEESEGGSVEKAKKPKKSKN